MKGGEAAEGLAEDGPALDAQMGAQVLGVGDDLVGAQMGEVLGLVGGRAERLAHGTRQAGAALVEQHDLVVGEGPAEPAGPDRVEARARRLAARAALEEQQVGPLGALRGRDDAGEDLDAALVVGVRVVEGDVDPDLTGQETGNAALPRHGPMLEGIC